MPIIAAIFIVVAPVVVALVSVKYEPAPVPKEPPAAFVQEINELERMPAAK